MINGSTGCILDLIAVTGKLLSGMTGATSTGGFWLIRRQTLVIDDERDEARP